jgi:hypothetical protein
MHTFAMKLDGYRPWTKRMSVSGTRQVHVEGKLVPETGDQPVEAQVPTLPKKPDEPVTQVIEDAGVIVDPDVKREYHWPIRSFSIWPENHTLALSKYKTFTLDLEPETAYQLSTNGSIDLGPKLGKTSSVMYYLEGEKIDPKDRFGFLTPAPKTIRGTSKLYAWVFDDDPSDNKGKLTFTIRISKYIPERFATFNPEEHVIVPSPNDILTVDGLLEDHTYYTVFRPDSPRLMGAALSHVFCVLESTKPKPIQKKYVWYPIKHIGNLTGVTGLTCMFLSHEKGGPSGLLEVDIDDLAEMGTKKKK